MNDYREVKRSISKYILSKNRKKGLTLNLLEGKMSDTPFDRSGLKMTYGIIRTPVENNFSKID